MRYDDLKVYWVEDGEATLAEPEDAGRSDFGVLVLACDPWDAMRIADLYDYRKLEYGNVPYWGETLAVVTDHNGRGE